MTPFYEYHLNSLYCFVMMQIRKEEKVSKRRNGFDPLPIEGRIYQKNEGGYVKLCHLHHAYIHWTLKNVMNAVTYHMKKWDINYRQMKWVYICVKQPCSLILHQDKVEDANESGGSSNCMMTFVKTHLYWMWLLVGTLIHH